MAYAIPLASACASACTAGVLGLLGSVFAFRSISQEL